MHRIEINGEFFNIPHGTLLSDFLMEFGFRVPHPCGGKGNCKKCTVIIDGKEELSCQYEITKDICITVESDKKPTVIKDEKAVDFSEYRLALDIGTTTLVMALVSADNYKIIRTVSRGNPQTVFGADVMSRIEYCAKNGVKTLNKILIDEINSLTEAIGIRNIKEMYVSGNATMLHTFLGVDCSSMGIAPYKAGFLEEKRIKAASIGITAVKEIITLPSISSFVGADIVAGLNFIGSPISDRYRLLVDLGTNAEIVLFNKDTVLCTSAAAGPCFEGAGISCGMSATSGAIYSYSRGKVRTIDNAEPKGICGTGLIDIIAALIDEKFIDNTGFMKDESFKVCDNIFINRKDIRQYQLAKSAVNSAVTTLLKIKNITPGEIEKVYLSGGISSEINVKNAAVTGLLDFETAYNCISIANSSLLGTAKYACSHDDLSQFIKKAQYIDLSENDDFKKLFIKNMNFRIL